MKCSILKSLKVIWTLLGFFLICTPAAMAQRDASKPIDLDRELRREVTPNRATSYYHFTIAKLAEEEGNLDKALSEMQKALDYDSQSSSIYMELAFLYEKSGSVREAIYSAEEAARLDPLAPDPHWLLANIYYAREGSPSANEGLTRAIQELEKVKQLAPKDERAYAYLGDAYFKLNQPDKAIESFETYQKLASGSDKGYQEIAKYYAQKGNIEKAIQYCLKGLDAQPDSAESLWLLSQLYIKLNKETEAIPVIRKLLPLTGNNPTIRRQLAETLMDANQYKEAAGLLEDLIKANPRDKKIYILLGRAQIELRQFSEAIETLQTVVKAGPEAPEAMEAQYFIAMAFERQNKYDESVKIYQSLVEKSAASTDESKSNRLLFQQRLAGTYEELREYQKAIDVYQEIIKAEPKATPGLVNAYRLDRQYDKALALGKSYYEKNPDDVRTALIYARALSDAGKGKEGAEILSKLLEANPLIADIYVNLSAIYLKDKRYSDAEKILHIAQDKKFEDEEDKNRVKLQLASVFEKQKNYDRAESMIKEVLKTKPDDAEALNYFGYMLADRGVRLDEAVRYIKEALAIEPRNGAFLDSLGWAYFKLNDMGNAKQYLLEAGDIIKDDPTIVEHLGDFYFKTGDFQKAQDYWKKSVSLGTEQEDMDKVRRKLDSLLDKLRKKK
jgi:tetratricopeptide (TPR) repeat protein